MRRYAPEDLSVLTPAEWDRWVRPLGADGPAQVRALGLWPLLRRTLAWELLYRTEPDLYERLVAGERIHPAIFDWLPAGRRVVELGAGSGRFTVGLGRCVERLIAVEPAAPLRERLRRRLDAESLPDVFVIDGFFDEVSLPDDFADLVVACSAFTVEPEHGGDAGLAQMERLCRPGGTVVVVWPDDPEWLRERGYEHQVFDGFRAVTFPSVAEAVAVARVFYPDAVPAIEAAGDRVVPYDVLGRRGPQDLSWRRIPA
jgi:SAM-dependent methyltransferase